MSEATTTTTEEPSRAPIYAFGIPIALIAAEAFWFFREPIVAWATQSMDHLMDWLGPVLVAPFVYLLYLYVVSTYRLIRQRLKSGRPAPLTAGGQLIFVYSAAPSLGLFGTFLGALIVCRSLAQKLPGFDLLLGSTVVFLGLSLAALLSLKLLHDGFRNSLEAGIRFEEDVETPSEEA